MNKKILKFVSAVSISAMLFTACAKAPKDALVKIGKEYITEEKVNVDYDKMKASFTDEQKKQYDDSTEEGKNAINSLKQNILDTMVNTEIIKQKFAKLVEEYKKEGKSQEEIAKITVDDSEVDEQIKTIKDQVGGEEKYKEELEKYKITEDELKKQLKDRMYSQKFQFWFSENFKPSDEEILEKYKGSNYDGPQIEASHILLESEEDAKKAKERLNSGEDFEKVAKELSKDPSVSNNGGNLGTFSKGVMVPEFYDAAIALKAGEISEPVKSQFGYHIIKLISKEDNFENFSEETKNTIKTRLENEIISSKYSEEFNKIKNEIGVIVIKNYKNVENK